MFINGQQLLNAAPIKKMINSKKRFEGTSYGLAEAGYDVRINQDIIFSPNTIQEGPSVLVVDGDQRAYDQGRFCLASTMEKFHMPNYLVGFVKDKSTWARQGLSLFTTVIEPGWGGFLTLELAFNGNEEIIIKKGQGIAQVLFGLLAEDADYGDGKYQNQENKPVTARF